MFAFRKIWRDLFSCNIRSEIRSFTLLTTICKLPTEKFHKVFKINPHKISQNFRIFLGFRSINFVRIGRRI